MPSCPQATQAEETKPFNPSLKGKDTCNTVGYELKICAGYYTNADLDSGDSLQVPRGGDSFSPF